MKLDNRKLAEVWRSEYEATRDEEAAAGAVATAVQAQLELPGVTPPRVPVEVRVVVVHEHHQRRFRCDARPLDVVSWVLTAVAKECDVEMAHLIGKWRRRSQAHAAARWVAAATLHDLGMSLRDIARAVGFDDHGSVSYALDRVTQRIDLQATVARVRAQLEAQTAPPADTVDAVEAA